MARSGRTFTEKKRGAAGEPTLPRLQCLLYGGDYNPEQWPEDVWFEDVELMCEAGVNLVSLGIFSWALLEPEPSIYDFGWLDRAIELLWSRGIAVNLATPTAAPPAWLVRRHPEILPVTADGVRLEFGSRRHYCPSSPVFREATVRLVAQLAGRYAEHPALAMWHVSNEYGCHVSACYCETSAEDFRRWLGERYGDLGALNDAWGTTFWGQRYGDWSEIAPPRRTPASVNPTQALDWARFCSDALLECYRAERSVLEELTPDVPITTNFMCRFKPADYWTWAREEDVVTLDSYPDPGDPEAHVQAALDYDLTRSLTGGVPWLLLEHATGAVNWREVNVPKRPGQMRLWAHQALARGSDGVMFFQWRAARAGAEKFHSGMVPHLGKVARGWQETVRLGQELRALAEVSGSTSGAEVGFLFDWENWWAFDGLDHPSQRLDLQALLLSWYRRFHARNVAVDFAHPLADLSGYRLVVAPNLYLAPDDAWEALTAFVQDGGVLAIGPFSGVVNESDHARCGPETEPFRRLIGARVEEVWPLLAGEKVAVEFPFGGKASAADWTEWLEPEGAEVVARYASGVLARQPAVLRNRLGEGVVHYSSAWLDEDGMAAIVDRALADAGVEPVLAASPGVEACLRRSARGSYLFVLNHTYETLKVDLPQASAFDLLEGRRVDRRLTLGPLGVAVLRELAEEEAK